MSVILDADKVVDTIFSAKQVKKPDQNYATTTLTGRIQTINLPTLYKYFEEEENLYRSL